MIIDFDSFECPFCSLNFIARDEDGNIDWPQIDYADNHIARCYQKAYGKSEIQQLRKSSGPKNKTYKCPLCLGKLPMDDRLDYHLERCYVVFYELGLYGSWWVLRRQETEKTAAQNKKPKATIKSVGIMQSKPNTSSLGSPQISLGSVDVQSVDSQIFGWINETTSAWMLGEVTRMLECRLQQARDKVAILSKDEPLAVLVTSKQERITIVLPKQSQQSGSTETVTLMEQRQEDVETETITAKFLVGPFKAAFSISLSCDVYETGPSPTTVLRCTYSQFDIDFNDLDTFSAAHAHTDTVNVDDFLVDAGLYEHEVKDNGGELILEDEKRHITAAQAFKLMFGALRKRHPKTTIPLLLPSKAREIFYRRFGLEMDFG